MAAFYLSDGTADRRRAFLYLVDATDGLTPETGEGGGQPQFSKNGAAWGNTSAVLVAIGNGGYYVEFTTSEIDTAGKVGWRYKSGNTAEFEMWADVFALNPFDAVRAGLTALPDAAAEAAGGLFTRGTGAGQLRQDANGRIDVNLVASKDVSVFNEDFTLASATSTTITLPATDRAGNTIPNDMRFACTVLDVVAGTGLGQKVVLTTPGGGTRQYNVLSGTMPAQLDSTSKCSVINTWRTDVNYWNDAAIPGVDTAGVPRVTVKDGTGAGELDTASGRVLADVVFWSGTALGGVDTPGYPKVTVKSGTGLGEIATSGGVANADVVRVSSDGPAADNLEAFLDGALFLPVDVVRVSGSQAAADNLEAYFMGGNFVATTVSDTTPAAGDFNGHSSLSAVDDFYVGSAIAFTSGTLKGLTRKCTDYVGATRTFLFVAPFPASPANGDSFLILGRIE